MTSIMMAMDDCGSDISENNSRNINGVGGGDANSDFSNGVVLVAEMAM